MFLSAPQSSRNEFGKLLNRLGLLGTAVEIGTHRGEFAHVLLDNWKGSMLYCVDPWMPYSQESPLPERGRNRYSDYQACQQRLHRHGGRFKLMRRTSAEAAEEFAENSIDFAYIDGDHSYEAVWLDLKLWWYRLRPGGILAGHDFIMPGEPEASNWARDIQRALADFVETLPAKRETPIQLIVEENGLPWSYYLRKEQSC